jgi:SlyX protein
MPDTRLYEQVVDLQTRFAFQEDNLQELNDIITRQQRQIDILERELELHREKLTDLLQAAADPSYPCCKRSRLKQGKSA